MVTAKGDVHRSPGVTIALFFLAIAVLGLVGACVAGWTVLVLSRPTTVRGQAWRLLAMTALTTGLVAGTVGGAVGAVRGLAHPSTAFFALWEGGALAGVPGLALGTVVGLVLAWDHHRQAAQTNRTAGGSTL